MSTRSGEEKTPGTGGAGGIRTEIIVNAPDCPIAKASKDSGRITGVNRSTTSSREGEIVEEFEVEGRAAPPSEAGVKKVFDLDGSSVYHLTRSRNKGCVCEVIEGFDCVVSDVSAENGNLHVTFYAPNVERIREITRSLNVSCGNVSLRELTRSSETAIEDLIFVDGSRLTERQKEVVRTAYEMGYFEHPKRANASDVAGALGIAPSTFTAHLSAAERKILDDFFEG